ncbi:MAG: sugar ABC transporter permease [Chloroflexota bacterium]|nr:sugar ABC transporter permease [Chloroflexota bacterium]
MKRRTFYMFMSPSLLVMLALMVFPLLTSIWLSMQYMTFRNINAPEFVGLANYLEVFDDRKFWQAFTFTMTFIAIAVPAQISVGFLIAVLLDQVSSRIRGIYIAAFLMPFIVVPVVGTLMVKQLFESGGIVAWAYRALLGSRFIFTEQSVKSLILLHSLWAATPFPLIVFFAGLQTLPDELIEASMIDGATRLRQVRHIMIPHLRSLFVFVGLISIMDAYRVFDSVFVLTEQNPIYKAEVMMLYTFRTAMSVQRLGKANAMSVITVVMILVVLVPFLLRTYKEQTEER